MRSLLLLIFLLILSITGVNAQESSGQYLTGNWGGMRDSLNSSGVSIQPRVTFFNQNYVAGIGDNRSVLNGKAQMKINLNGRKFGLPKWTLVTKLEYNFGATMEGAGAVLLPTNTAMAFPGFNSGNRFDVSTFYVAYNWSNKNQLLFGKINQIDLYAGPPVYAGAGIDGFWNIGLAAPASGIAAPYIFGAIAVIPGKTLNWVFMVYDPISAVRNTGLESPFREGVAFSISPSFIIKIGDRPGIHAFRVAWSNRDGNIPYDLGDLRIPLGFPSTNRSNRYYINYSFLQPIITYADGKNGWKAFGQIAYSDGNPNPLNYSYFFGIAGDGFFKNRAMDQWGLGYYHYSLSNYIDDLAGENGAPFDNEAGIEMYYQYWMNRWFSIGGNIQVVDPVVRDAETAVFIGLRSSIRF